MTCYSHSRLKTFDQCKYKYKLKYIDKIKVDIPTTIEAFVGDLVHQILEKLYSTLKLGMILSLDNILLFYNLLWDNKYSSDILVAKKYMAPETYRKMGEDFIKTYYEKHEPFNELTIVDLETVEKMDLPDGNQWHVRIDKLGKDDEGNYYVCDYKTGARRQGKEEADKDQQLAMYSIWVKNKFDAKKIILKWHMLAFGEDIESIRTDDELVSLQNEIIEKIKEIESATKFPTNVTRLCSYCVFKDICPEFRKEC